MRKSAFFLAFMLLTSFGFAQSKMPFTSSKPFNKGNFKIDASYSQLMQQYSTLALHDFRIDVSYGFTDWCVAGVFGSFGTHDSFMKVGGGYSIQGTDTTYHPVVFDGKRIERYYHYGINVELHPLSLLLPNFYFVDVYCRGELGMRTITNHYIPDYQDTDFDDFTNSIYNDFLIGGSVGVAINPSRYFGLFYEYAYDNLNKKTIDHPTGTKKSQPIHRFGINVRFGGPKKWQN